MSIEAKAVLLNNLEQQLATIITAAVVLIGVAPMFGYNIDKGMRDEMYKELNARRAATAQRINEAYEEGAEQ